MKKLSLFLIALAMILVSCKPEVEKPTVVTKSVGEITETTATVSGNVTSDGGAEVTSRGVCYATSDNITLDNAKTVCGGSGVGGYMVELLNLKANTTYYVKSFATNEAGVSYGEEVSFTTLEVENGDENEEPETPIDPEDPSKPSDTYAPTGTINGHDYVDLGLPSGLKWATCNVGASKPRDFGNYYAWGETTTKETYDSDNCPTYGLSKSELQSQGYIDSEGNLALQYDAATANWGGDWRMPTEEELEELYGNCTWEYASWKGVHGYKVTGPNGNSIFLPAAGYRIGSSLYYAGSYGSYWSSTPYGNYDGDACYLYFHSSDHDVDDDGYRSYGRSVRPILE